MAYIPRYSPLSLQEIQYAPALMRQQHDEAVANQMALDEALQFDYLKQDASILEPKLQKYSSDIEAVSSDLSKRGFSPDIKNRIVGLQRQYKKDDTLRKVQKNYADAMTGWEETKKGLIAQKASGEEIAKQKAAYFSPEAYKGAFDEEGFYREFTPGATSNIYNIAEDTQKTLSNLGKTGKIVGQSGASIEAVEGDLTKGIPPHYRIYNSKTGQMITTDDQLEAAKTYIKSEYDPTNPYSDRGMYSKIMNYDPNYINTLVDNIGESMRTNYYQQLPQRDVDIQGVGTAGKPVTPPGVIPPHQKLNTDDSKYKDAQKDEKILTTGVGTTKKSTGMRSTPSGTKIAYETIEDPVARQKYDNVVKKYKENYPSLYTTMDDSTATSIGIQFEKEYSAFKYSYIPLKSDKASENVYNSLVDFTGEGPLLDEDGDKVKFSDLTKSFQGTGLDWKSVPPLTSPEGDIYLTDANGAQYKVDPNALDVTTQNIQKLTKDIFNQISDPSIFDKDNDKPIDMKAYTPEGKRLYMHVLNGAQTDDPIQQYNINNRLVELIAANPDGSYDRLQIMQPGEVFQNISEGMRSGFQFYKK